MPLRVYLDGFEVLRAVGSGFGDPLGDPEIGGRRVAVADALAQWASRYRQAASVGNEGLIHGVGAEMFAWLDAGGAVRDWLAGSQRVLEIEADPARPGALSDALLDAPWEVLSRDGIFLAQDLKLFVVARRCGGRAELPAPAHSDVALMFMAAAPVGQSVLDFEREETAILEATRARDGRGPLAHLDVEESGALEFLTERLRLDGPFDALHLSCHGDIRAPEGGVARPELLFETETGAADPVDPARLIGEVGDRLPPLVFVSACRTAERGGAAAGPRPEGLREAGVPWSGGAETDPHTRDGGVGAVAEAPPDLADPYVRQLADHAANVIGWDGSVYDRDATQFSRDLYGALARGDTVPVAAAKARRALLQARAEDPKAGRHWHLARVYLGPGGGGALADPQAAPRPARPKAEAPFLDARTKRVPVARREEFVGRRRAIQKVIGAFRAGHTGALVHGMGHLGKSSLAARVAERMAPRHRRAVVFGEVTPRTLMAALGGVIGEIADGMEDYTAAKRLQDEFAAFNAAVADDPGELGDILRRLLRGLLTRHPVLLILDDFEAALETPQAGGGAVGPNPACREALLALSGALQAAETPSRLLITSRYDFALRDPSGDDRAAPLVRVPLTPMDGAEQVKQVQARARAAAREDGDEIERRLDAAGELVRAALAAAGGNPGLQAVLTGPILAGQAAEARAAIAAIEAFAARGEAPPEGDDLGDFFTRMAFGTYAQALSGSEASVLGAATLFATGVPVPRGALVAAASARGLADPGPAIDRLLVLGLLDDWGAMAGWPGMAAQPHLAANPLARPLVHETGGALAEAEPPALAAAALPALAAAWQDHQGDFPPDPRGVEAARLALLADPIASAVLDAAATAAVRYLRDIAPDYAAAAQFGGAALDALANTDHPPHEVLIGKTVEAAGLAGATALQEKLIDTTLARGDLNARQRAVFSGLRADRLMRTGDLAEARRIREDECLPAFEALGDTRAIALTRGQIADILQARGDLAEARRILEAECLPAYAALGDTREIAIARGKIADILQAQGDLAEARRIREEECLPAFKALGDTREVALTKGKIADILHAEGDLDGASAMHLDLLPVFQEMNDIDGIAHVRFSCAQLRLARGEHERAGLQTIHDELAEAFAIQRHLQRPDGIGAVGALLGEVLAMGGHPAEAIDVLRKAAEAFAKIGQQGGVDQCNEVIAMIEARKD